MKGKEIILKLVQGGVGIYILGAPAVAEDGFCFPGNPRAIIEKDLPTLEERAKIIKSQGALAINHIHHAGALALKQYSGVNPLAPSAEKGNENLKFLGQYTSPCQEFTDERINKLINEFANATELSLKAGFDELNFMLQINIFFNNFILHPLINEQMIGGAQMKKE